MDPHALLGRLGLSPRSLENPESWLPQSVWKAVWEDVIAWTGQPALALKAAAGIDRGYFGVIDYVARSCPNMDAAITSAARYFRLANTQGHLRLERLPDGLRISRHLLGDEGLYLPRQAAEFALATMLRVFRGACAQPFELDGVSFRYPPPEDIEPFQQAFACPLRFSASHDALFVSNAALALPMREPDERLRAMISQHGDSLLRALPSPRDSTLAAVRGVLAGSLQGGDPSIDQVAKRLGMSRRSLQCAMRAESTTFSSVCEHMRKELACSYLSAGVSVGEVAFLLGYAEVPPFHRAFRRWTGQTPGDWKRLAPKVKVEAPTVNGSRP